MILGGATPLGQINKCNCLFCRSQLDVIPCKCDRYQSQYCEKCFHIEIEEINNEVIFNEFKPFTFKESSPMSEQGKKFDSGKPRISILQGRAIEMVMQVGEMGAVKYGDHNYRKGMPVTKFINAAFRHVFIEWLFKGIDNDEESGMPHLAHGAWNLLAALEQMLTKPELDDRYKGE